MVGSPRAEIRETRWGQAAFMAAGPEEPPSGSQSVHSSEETGNDRGAKGRRKVEVRRTERRKSKPTRVPARANRWWNQPSTIGSDDTERLTDGLGDEAKSRSLSTEHPPTGKPDAGEPPVRFGGRGSGYVRSPYPYRRASDRDRSPGRSGHDCTSALRTFTTRLPLSHPLRAGTARGPGAYWPKVQYPRPTSRAIVHACEQNPAPHCRRG
jgi:hypothetical protein